MNLASGIGFQSLCQGIHAHAIFVQGYGHVLGAIDVPGLDGAQVGGAPGDDLVAGVDKDAAR